MSALASALQGFFSEHLQNRRRASPHTIAAYRDSWRMLLRFASEQLAKEPSQLDLSDLDAPMIAAFLDHIERERRCSIRSRNARLAAIRALYRYAALDHPEHAATIERVLAIPAKRHERTLVTFLEDRELEALLAAPDLTSRVGRRDRAMILLGAESGLRASELTALRWADLELGRGAHVRCLGKGRKHRVTPLGAQCTAVLITWQREQGVDPAAPVFASNRGSAISRGGFARRLALHGERAGELCPSLGSKRITPHVLRHTAAMRLLRAGVDVSVIALWLGHEQIETTQVYLHADLALKEQALARTTPPGVEPGRYRAPDELLAFLDGL